MNRLGYAVIAAATCLWTAACGEAPSESGSTSSAGGSTSSAGGGTSSAGGGGASSGGCTLTDNTVETPVANAAECHVLERDTSACAEARKAAGLSGYWLKLSCRVSLSTSGGEVQAKAD